MALVAVVAALVAASCSAAEPQIGSVVDSPPPTPAATTTPPTTQAPAITTTPTTTTSTTTTTPPPTTTTTAPRPSTTTSTLPPVPEGGTERITLQVGGRSREYVLFVPGGLGPGPYPLVVDFHGLTDSGDGHDSLSRMRAKGAEEGFVVAQPDGALLGNSWDVLADSSDVQFVRALVADTASRVPIDPDRTFATGFSAGGGLVNRLACESSDLFAAVGSVAGSYLSPGRCSPTRAVPFAAFHGDDDLVVPYNGGLAIFPSVPAWAQAWADRNGCDPTPSRSVVTDDVVVDEWQGCGGEATVVFYTVRGGGHDWPGPGSSGGILQTTESISATDLLWEFFVAHPRLDG
jgi:polyhydroxybutyrate depolymerase